MMKRTLCIAVLGCFLALSPLQAETASYRFQREHVLGTSFELTVTAASRAVAESAERVALAEIDRLNQILSSYDASSEFMRWQSKPVHEPLAVSADLAIVLASAEHWRRESMGAFDPRVPAFASREGRPSRSVVAQQLSQAPYAVNAHRVVSRNDAFPMTLDGLAKGYIIDQVCEAISSQCPSIEQFVVNIGGDFRKAGNGDLHVSVTNPFRSAEGDSPWEAFPVKTPLAMATSGNYRRGAHLIDPRVGLPATGVASASVIAPTAIQADALATIVSILSPAKSLSLIGSLDGVECMLVLAGGQRVASTGWPQADRHNDEFVAVQDKKADSGLIVKFTLNRPKGGRYRRPYVAVWLEDADGFPVKTALLWMQTEQPGPRWHRDLTRWYRNDRTRKLVEKLDLINTVATATRGPGEYTTRFDGKDNAGKPLPSGEYTLCLEVAREHGTYQLIRKKVRLNGEPIDSTKLEGNVEISAASFRYVPVVPAAQ